VVGEMKARLYARFDADYGAWMAVVRAVAHLDCLVGLSVFNEGGLGEPKCRPEFVEVGDGRAFVEFEELRHPCILEGYLTCLKWANERIKQDFIPNDVSLGGKVPNLVLLTGANMVSLLLTVIDVVGW
jgi:DNA mismatch repair protein MSH6